MALKKVTLGQIQHDQLMIMIAGKSGIGKTSLIRTLPPKETLVIDSDKGLRSLAGFDADLEVWSVDDASDVYDAIKELKKGVKQKYIVIDMFSTFCDKHRMALKQTCVSKDGKTDSFKVWSEFGDDIKKIIDSLKEMRQYDFILTSGLVPKGSGLEERLVMNFTGEKVQESARYFFDFILKLDKVVADDGSEYRALITSGDDFCKVRMPPDRQLPEKVEPHLGKLINTIKGMKK